jgi:hypothetical protein
LPSTGRDRFDMVLRTARMLGGSSGRSQAIQGRRSGYPFSFSR